MSCDSWLGIMHEMYLYDDYFHDYVDKYCEDNGVGRSDAWYDKTVQNEARKALIRQEGM